MKTLIENNGCKFALTTSEEPNRHGFGSMGSESRRRGALVGDAVLGPSYPHLFCGEPQKDGSPYCAEHHKLCYRGHGKDPRALEEMIYAVDQSQYRGSTGFADHTDPMDVELAREHSVLPEKRERVSFAVEKASRERLRVSAANYGNGLNARGALPARNRRVSKESAGC